MSICKVKDINLNTVYCGSFDLKIPYLIINRKWVNFDMNGDKVSF